MTRLLVKSLLLLIYLGACTDKKATQSSAVATAAADTIPVFILSSSQIDKSIELPAELLPYEKAELAAKAEGYISDMKVDIGDHVRKGQTLAVIDAPELGTKFAEYQASLAAAQARYQSSRDLYGRLLKASQAKTAGIVAPVDLEKSLNQMQADSAAFESAKRLAQSYGEMAGYLVIKAPFEGIVTARYVDRGTLVVKSSPILTLQNTAALRSSPILTLQNTAALRLRIAVPELYISTGTASKEASFRVESSPDKSYTAKLARKSGAIDPKTRTEIWEYTFNNPGNELKAGSFAYVQLKLERNSRSFVVAPNAIATNQERKFVIVVKDNQAVWEDIRQGLSTEKGIEIFGNLQAGDTLLVRATDERKPGARGYWKVAL
jgi:membrane fusion protein, multidrug efflux system